MAVKPLDATAGKGLGQPLIQRRGEGCEGRRQYDAKARQADQGVPGLYYLRARYYDPSIGRFLSQDPLPFVPPVSSSAWGQTTPSTGGAPLATTCTTASAARPEQ